MADFSDAERKVIQLISHADSFEFEGETYHHPQTVAKPSSSTGEPKTDIFVEAIDSKNIPRQFKISFKLSDAAFPQNKITEDIANEHEMRQTIFDAAETLRDEFANREKAQNRALLHFERPSCGRGKGKNSRKLTVGWKCEANTKPRDLSVEITGEERIRLLRSMYLGTNQPDDKRNAFVNSVRVNDSGIPNFMLQSDIDRLTNVQDIFDNLETVDDYINARPSLYIIFTGLNYFIDDGYFEATRELWVWPRWYVEKGLLCSELCYDEIRIARDVEQNFFDCIIEMGLDPEQFELDQIQGRLHSDVLIHE